MGCVSLCLGLDKQESASVPKRPTLRVQVTGLKLSNTLSCENTKITHQLLIVFTKHHDAVVGTSISSEIFPYFRSNISLVYFVVLLRFSREKNTIVVEIGKKVSFKIPMY